MFQGRTKTEVRSKKLSSKFAVDICATDFLSLFPSLEFNQEINPGGEPFIWKSSEETEGNAIVPLTGIEPCSTRWKKFESHSNEFRFKYSFQIFNIREV